MILPGILKIAAIVLLCIIGFIILIIFLLLFAPFRYKISGSFHDETPDGFATVKWLWGVLGFKADFRGDEPQAYIGMFGFKIYDLLSGRESEETDIDEDITETELIFSDDDYDQDDELYPVYDTPTPIGNQTKPDGKDSSTETSAESDIQKDIHSETAAHYQGVNHNKKAGESVNNTANAHDVWSWYSLRERIRPLILKIRPSASQIIDFLVKKTCQLFKNLLKFFREEAVDFLQRNDKTAQIRALYDLYNDRRYRDDLKMLKDRVFRLLKEICPRKGKGRVRFGISDPFTMGQIMQIAAMLYPLYAKSITVIPDFDNDIIDGDLNIRGRVRLFIPLEAGLRIFFNKNLRIIYKKTRRILEMD